MISPCFESEPKFAPIEALDLEEKRVVAYDARLLALKGHGDMVG